MKAEIPQLSQCHIRLQRVCSGHQLVKLGQEKNIFENVSGGRRGGFQIEHEEAPFYKMNSACSDSSAL